MPLIRKGGDQPPSAPASAEARVRALQTGSAEQRWDAARSLSDHGSEAVLKEALATESEPRVREAILTSLARIGTPESAEAVIPHIRSNDASLRTAALDALRAMPTAAAVRLPELMTDSDPDVRLLACEVARHLPGDEATRLLCKLLETEQQVNVCAAAVEVLAEVGGPEAVPALQACVARFGAEPFLVFSIRVATERLAARTAAPLG